MLSGNVRQQPCAIAGLQMKRSYRGAFLDDLRHRQDAPPGGKRGSTQPVGGLRPVTGHQRIRGPAVLPEGPAQGQSVAAANNAASLERPQPFRPLESRNLWRIQNDLGVTGHLQHVATRVVDEDKPGLAVQYDIAERCKEEVSIEVRNGKRAIVRNTNEAGLATAMGHVDLASIFAVGIRRDKKCVCRRDHGTCIAIEVWQVLHATGKGFPWITNEFEITQLDVARAVSEALVDIDLKAPLSGGDCPVHPIAAPRMHLHAEQADRLSVRHAFACGVADIPSGRDIENGGRRRGHEA
jgi:hypothetical protein